MDDKELLNMIPALEPSLTLVWSAIIEVGESLDLGKTALGHRFMVPITGGRFYEGPAGPGLNGIVMSGGADRQLLRSDGIKELDALYEMVCESGPTLTIRNRVLIDPSQGPERYAMSSISTKIVDGPMGWLNRRLFVGTLYSLRPTKPLVVVRAWLLANETVLSD